MKKAVSILIIISLLCTFSACKEELKVSEQHYQYGKKAIEIADQYLDYEISAEEAYSMLESLIAREDELPDTDFYDNKHASNDLVETIAFSLETEVLISQYNSSSEIYISIKESRNLMAETIGEKIRK